jgi:curved DNA-binding protein CbpA
MTDPFQVLELPPDADDVAIRARYLELVRRWPPEQAPERFAAVRAAYEQVRDRDARLRHRLFDAGRNTSIDGLIEEAVCRTRCRRVTLAELLTVHRGR